MKAEHRKELETNVLADRLGRLVEGVKEGPSPTIWLVLGGVALAVLLVFVWRYFTHEAEAKSAERWVTLDGLTTAADLEEFINNKDNLGTPQLRSAQFEFARLTLVEGLRQLGQPLRRAMAIAQLKKAAATYEQLTEDSRDTPLLQEEALIGAARANESLGELTKARTYYERLVAEHGTSVLARDAKAALTRLGDEKNAADLKALADLLAQTREQPSLPPSPGPGVSP
jgi:tetratricopeptide (TPR) repeat protein